MKMIDVLMGPDSRLGQILEEGIRSVVNVYVKAVADAIAELDLSEGALASLTVGDILKIRGLEPTFTEDEATPEVPASDAPKKRRGDSSPERRWERGSGMILISDIVRVASRTYPEITEEWLQGKIKSGAIKSQGKHAYASSTKSAAKQAFGARS